MISTTSTHSCPVSGRTEGELFVQIPQVPTLCNALYDDRASAQSVSRGDLDLAYFPTSGHVYNVSFDPDRLSYTESYENSLHHSPRFRAYARDLADHLIDTYNIRRKTVVDIGCGNGEFLGLLCERGDNTGIGYDPSYEPDPADEDQPFSIVQDLYSEKYADQEAALICCQHVLEHVADPLEFARTVRRAVGDRRDAIVYFEVPNALFTLRDLGTWDLIYEHCSYFTPSSLSFLFQRAGFDVLQLSEAFGGQYLQIELRAGTPMEGPSLDEDLDPALVRRYVDRFSNAYEEKRSYWNERFARLRAEGKTAVVWGAGSKGVSFLNAVPEAAHTVNVVVDVNQKKQGKFVAGTGHEIVPPSTLRIHAPDLVVLMNGVYEAEIREMVSDLGLAPEFEVAS